MPTPSGYSGTPLAKKLGISSDTTLLVVGAPANYREWLGADVAPTLVKKGSVQVDVAHVFTAQRAVLTDELTRLRRQLRPDAAVWVSWPKKSAKVPTDITEDIIRTVALPMGWVDIKVCAVTETWSGLKLVVRKELRG